MFFDTDHVSIVYSIAVLLNVMVKCLSLLLHIWEVSVSGLDLETRLAIALLSAVGKFWDSTVNLAMINSLHMLSDSL